MIVDLDVLVVEVDGGKGRVVQIPGDPTGEVGGDGAHLHPTGEEEPGDGDDAEAGTVPQLPRIPHDDVRPGQASEAGEVGDPPLTSGGVLDDRLEGLVEAVPIGTGEARSGDPGITDGPDGELSPLHPHLDGDGHEGLEVAVLSVPAEEEPPAESEELLVGPHHVRPEEVVDRRRGGEHEGSLAGPEERPAGRRRPRRDPAVARWPPPTGRRSGEPARRGSGGGPRSPRARPIRGPGGPGGHRP